MQVIVYIFGGITDKGRRAGLTERLFGRNPTGGRGTGTIVVNIRSFGAVVIAVVIDMRIPHVDELIAIYLEVVALKLKYIRVLRRGVHRRVADLEGISVGGHPAVAALARGRGVVYQRLDIIIMYLYFIPTGSVRSHRQRRITSNLRKV